jgi:hypothetical protein
MNMVGQVLTFSWKYISGDYGMIVYQGGTHQLIYSSASGAVIVYWCACVCVCGGGGSAEG